MSGLNRPIFRPEAVRRYARRNDCAVYPRLLSPRVAPMLWVLFGLAVVCGGLSRFARVPVYVSGGAVVVERAGQSGGGSEEAILAVFLPARDSHRLRPGQRVFFGFGGEPAVLVGKVEAVEPQGYGAEAVRSRFALDGGAVRQVRGPTAVAFARAETAGAGSPRSAEVGEVGEARVEVGSRRALTLLPLAGRLIEDGQE